MVIILYVIRNIIKLMSYRIENKMIRVLTKSVASYSLSSIHYN